MEHCIWLNIRGWPLLIFDHSLLCSFLPLLAISFYHSEWRHSTLKINSCCQMYALLKQKKRLNLSRFNQAAAVKTCFWNALLNFLLWRLEGMSHVYRESTCVHSLNFYRAPTRCQSLGTEAQRLTEECLSWGAFILVEEIDMLAKWYREGCECRHQSGGRRQMLLLLSWGEFSQRTSQVMKEVYVLTFLSGRMEQKSHSNEGEQHIWRGEARKGHGVWGGVRHAEERVQDEYRDRIGDRTRWYFALWVALGLC